MQKQILLLSMFSIQFYELVFGQINNSTYCLTPQITSNIYLNKRLNSGIGRIDSSPFCLKLYFHVIRQSNGDGGQSISSVQEAFNIIQGDFNPHNIFFDWDNEINYIDDNNHYLTPKPEIFTINNHTDGIDIYLYDDSAPAGGRANGVGNSSDFFVSGVYWESPYTPLVSSHVISHELGHVLFLWHTHHGTSDEGNANPDKCPELVNGSNSATCGDYVTDTPADPHLDFDVDSSNCTWNSSGQDSNGDSYQPDEENIMAYSHVDCLNYFTDNQGERMRNAILNLGYLQNVNYTPSSNNISITSTGSYILSDKRWTRLVVNYEGKTSDTYHWEWIIPSCYSRFGPKRTYVDVRPITRMGISNTFNHTINVQVKATDNCESQSDWFIKPFEVQVSPGIIPDDDMIFDY